MTKMSKTERIQLTKNGALKIGLQNRHAEVLAKISSKKDLDSRVRYLMDNFKGYRDMIGYYNKMIDDPVAFYYQNKSIKYGSNKKKFSRYGNLSLMYSFASPIQLINVLLADAEIARNWAIHLKEIGDYEHKDEEYFYISFEELRFSRLEEAFKQDLKGNKIPQEIVNKLLNALDWDKTQIIDAFGIGKLTKQMIMDSFYLFFSSKGEEFIRSWQDKTQRKSLIDQFTHSVYNDPHINYHLINKKPWEHGFEKACQEFSNSEIFNANGQRFKREEIDARYTKIL